MTIKTKGKFYEELGSNILKLRTTAGVSQHELSRHIGLSRTSVLGIEKGRQAIDILPLVKIAEYLMVPITDLLPLSEYNVQQVLIKKDINDE